MLGRAGNGANLFGPPAPTTASGYSYGTHGTFRASHRRGARDDVPAAMLAAAAGWVICAAARRARQRWNDARGGGGSRRRCLLVDRGRSDAPMDPSRSMFQTTTAIQAAARR